MLVITRLEQYNNTEPSRTIQVAQVPRSRNGLDNMEHIRTFYNHSGSTLLPGGHRMFEIF